MAANMPKNNQEFWRRNLVGNKIRDKVVSRELKSPLWVGGS